MEYGFNALICFAIGYFIAISILISKTSNPPMTIVFEYAVFYGIIVSIIIKILKYIGTISVAKCPLK
jgi:hypothetical protein